MTFSQPGQSLWPGEETRIVAARLLISILMSTWHDPTPLPEKLSQIVKKRSLLASVEIRKWKMGPTNVVITCKPLGICKTIRKNRDFLNGPARPTFLEFCLDGLNRSKKV